MNMDIKIEGEIEKVQEANDKSVDQPQQTLDTPSDMHYIAVKQVFDIDRDSDEYDDDINILVRWAKQQVDDDDPIALKWAIRDLRMRLGTPTHGESIKHLTRFAYLDMEEKRIKREKQEFI